MAIEHDLADELGIPLDEAANLVEDSERWGFADILDEGLAAIDALSDDQLSSTGPNAEFWDAVAVNDTKLGDRFGRCGCQRPLTAAGVCSDDLCAATYRYDPANAGKAFDPANGLSELASRIRDDDRLTPGEERLVDAIFDDDERVPSQAERFADDLADRDNL